MPGRGLIAATLLVGLAVFAAGWQRIGTEPGWVVRDSFLPGVGPTVLTPGLRFVAPGLFDLHRYPAGPITEPFALGRRDSSAPPAVSREGALLRVEGKVIARIAPDGVFRLHLQAGPRFRERQLQPIVHSLLIERLRTRSADPGPAGRQRLALDLAADLRAPLAAIGIDILGVRIDRLEPLPGTRVAVEGWPRDPGLERARLLWIGWDGADWTVIDRLLQEGRMPNLARLIETGVRARLRTVEPVLSPVIWTSIATGTAPARHGIIDFVATDATTGERIPVTSNLRRTEAIWNLVSGAGLRVGVTAWLATWPAEPVRGYLVSDRVVPFYLGLTGAWTESSEGKVYPSGSWEEVRQAIVTPDRIEDAEIDPFFPAARLAELPSEPRAAELLDGMRGIIASTRSVQAIHLRLREAAPAPFEAVYYLGIDRVSHLFMPYRPPRMEGVDPVETEILGAVVDRFYEYQDRLLAELIETADEWTTIVLCSDHGFRSGADRRRTDPRIGHGRAADWHRRYGILLLQGPAVRAGIRLERASVLDLAPTALALLGLPVPADLEGRVLVEALRPEFLRDHPVRYRGPVNRDAGGPPQAPIASAEDAAIKEQLLSLGYLSQDSLSAHNNLGILHLRAGRLDEAIREFEAALERDPGFAAVRVNLSRALIARGDEERARAVLRRTVMRHPDEREAWLLLARLALREGPEVAERYYLRALALDPGDPAGRLGLGGLYESMGRRAAAEEQYRAILEVDPGHAGAYNSLGTLFLRNGRAQEARQMFESATRADPDSAVAFHNLGLALQDLEAWPEAEAAFRRGMEREPSNPLLHAGLGGLLLRAGRLAEARQELETAVRIDPALARAHNNLGGALALLGDPDGALRHYRRALELLPDYTDARYNLAMALREAGEGRAAALELETALSHDPAHTPSLLLLARLRLEEGRGEEARRILEESLRVHPDQPAVREELRIMTDEEAGR